MRVGIDRTDPDDAPDEPGLPRPSDGPRSSGSESPTLPDSAEREVIRRAYQDLVGAVYADIPQGTSDTPDKPTTFGHAPRDEAPRLPRDADEDNPEQH